MDVLLAYVRLVARICALMHAKGGGGDLERKRGTAGLGGITVGDATKTHLS